MRILHTADWHLGDRLGRVDRTADLQKAVERVARCCQEEAVEVLLIAGDLFSELSRPHSLRESIAHLQATFEPFLRQGGTILAITGNHDNETFCQTLQMAMELATPAAGARDPVAAPGRLYLASRPAFLRLADRQGTVVQFLLLPYPTPSSYLEDEVFYRSREELQRLLQKALVEKLQELQGPPFQPAQPSVLMAHLHVQGVPFSQLFRLSEEESLLFSGELFAPFTYTALGHIHKHQTVQGKEQIRYSGSIERLDLGEQNDNKGVVLVEIGPSGLIAPPRFLPLPATKIYRVEVRQPAEEVPRLRSQYPQAENDLVQLHITYQAGRDNLEALLKELADIFPRWYDRKWEEVGELDRGSLADPLGPSAASPQEIVRAYLQQELAQHSPEDRDAVLALAEQLFRELDEVSA